MEGLRALFDAVTLCMKRLGVVKDVRRLILALIIKEEYIDRYKSNCCGPAYKILSHMGINRHFVYGDFYSLEDLNNRREPGDIILDTDNTTSDHGNLNKLILLNKPATKFFSTCGVLGEWSIPINHSSEGLGLITPALCIGILGEYIRKHKLKNSRQKRYVAIDSKLSTVLITDCGFRMIVRESTGEPVMHFPFSETAVMSIIKNDLRHAGQIRYIKGSVMAYLQKMTAYFDSLTVKRR